MSFLKKSLGVVSVFFTVIFIGVIAISGQAGNVAPVEIPQGKVTVTDNPAARQGLVLGDETKKEEKVVEDKPAEPVIAETQAPAQEESKQAAPPAPSVQVPVAKVAEKSSPAPTPPAPAPVKVTAPVTPKPAPPAPTPTPIIKSSAKYYTSSHYSAKLYYPENCDGWESLSKTYLRSFDSLDALLAKYPNRTLSPQCN